VLQADTLTILLERFTQFLHHTSYVLNSCNFSWLSPHKALRYGETV